jgi:hypothetical protein
MAESDDLRSFIRELMARYDRKMDRIDARMEREAAETRAYLEEIRAKTNDILAENRAQRQALLRMLDRMDGNGGTSAA